MVLVTACSASAAMPIQTEDPRIAQLTFANAALRDQVAARDAVTPVPTPHQFSAKSFTVNITYALPEDRAIATQAITALPTAWSTATRGLSTIQVVNGGAEVYVDYGPEPSAIIPAGIQRAWYFSVVNVRFVYIHHGVTDVTIVIHELGHLIGCCDGAPGAGPDGHWADCPAPSVEIMCHFQGTATTFSDRELRAMGLLP